MNRALNEINIKCIDDNVFSKDSFHFVVYFIDFSYVYYVHMDIQSVILKSMITQFLNTNHHVLTFFLPLQEVCPLS